MSLTPGVYSCKHRATNTKPMLWVDMRDDEQQLDCIDLKSRNRRPCYGLSAIRPTCTPTRWLHRHRQPGVVVSGPLRRTLSRSGLQCRHDKKTSHTGTYTENFLSGPASTHMVMYYSAFLAISCSLQEICLFATD